MQSYDSPPPRVVAMADLLLSEAFSAGKKILHMLETAKDCVDEGKELAGRCSAVSLVITARTQTQGLVFRHTFQHKACTGYCSRGTIRSSAIIAVSVPEVAARASHR